MPVTVKRQQANGPPAAAPIRGKPGSVLSRAIPVGDIRDSWIKMLLYGGNGIGKTTLACQFPKPLLLLSYERCPSGGARSVRRMPGVTWLRVGLPDGVDPNDPTVEIKAADVIADTERLAAELRVSNPFKTVVFDHVTVFQDWVLESVTGAYVVQQGKGKVTTDQYVQRAELTKGMLRPWVDLPCDTVFIGKEKDHNPPKEEKVSATTGKVQPDLRPRWLRGMQQESFVTVELGGGTTGWLQDAVDYGCRLYMDREVKVTESKSTIQGKEVVHRDVAETGNFVRALRVKYHPNYFSRFRADNPDELPDAIEAPTWAKIQAAIEGRAIPEK